MHFSGMIRIISLSLFIVLTISSVTFGQVVWTEPPFPSQNMDITLYYDASEGNGALSGQDQVWAHMGLITSESANGGDWKNVVGVWGTADPQVYMQHIGEDLFSKTYNIADFHNVQEGTEVLKLAFVFRNANGTIVGRDADGTDIFYDVYPESNALFANLNSPQDNSLIQLGDSIHIDIQFSDTADITIYDNGVEIGSALGSEGMEFYYKPSTSGNHELEFIGIGEQNEVTLNVEYFVFDASINIIDPPADVRNGLNYYSDSTFLFQLRAPGKQYSFLLCPENEFKYNEDFLMNRSGDGTTFWIELPRSMFEDGNNLYQYAMDGAPRVADPFSMFVLDFWADPEVDENVMAGFPDYPFDLTSEIASTFYIEKPEYPWTVENFEKPDKHGLVIYELLIRDFLEDHSYASLLDTLDYLQNLGVNAIELMPVAEFEWNRSWGYNVSHHMALDKYYGTADQLKAFIDEAHKRGIAIIQDVVFNHAFGQSPVARMYWDDSAGRPAENNPYLNVYAKHPYSVGEDFNHESPYTKEYVKQCLQYWIEEFKFDGFRFDLSKGFTQKQSSGVEAWSSYDQSRINILKDYADFIWSVDPTNYVILEHFAENNEEKVLANYGMMLWGNMVHEFNEATMGYASDMSWIDYRERAFEEPNNIAYMESHDEERLMYKNLNYGDEDGEQNVRELHNALRRMETATALFYSIPGPRMLWQFGELGYDYSINHCPNGSIDPDCRTSDKPIVWNYYEELDRNRLHDVTAAMLNLRNNYPVFHTDDFTFYDGNYYLKTLNLNHTDMDAVVMANFRTNPASLNPKFQHTGTWYEYFTGDSLVVTDTQEKLDFSPGEYRIYLSKPVTPPGGTITAVKDFTLEYLSVYPNPVFSGIVHIILTNDKPVDRCWITDMQGRRNEQPFNQSGKELETLIQGYAPGVYILNIQSGSKRFISRLVVTE